jgi:hypothetical protein
VAAAVSVADAAEITEDIVSVAEEMMELTVLAALEAALEAALVVDDDMAAISAAAAAAAAALVVVVVAIGVRREDGRSEWNGDGFLGCAPRWWQRRGLLYRPC